MASVENGEQQWDDIEVGRAPACDLEMTKNAATLSWSHLRVVSKCENERYVGCNV